MADILGVTPQTIRKYAKNGQIPYHTTPSGQLIFTDQDIQQALNHTNNTNTTTPVQEKWALYARSSSGDTTIINNQLNTLKQYCQDKNITHTITDKASGMNEHRKGINKLIKLAKQGEITDIIATRKDRYTTFGYTYLQELFNAYNVSIHYLTENTEQKTIENELMDDFMTITTSFAGRLSQMRSKEAKQALLQKAIQRTEQQ